MFKLPAYQELSKEQDNVFRLPLDGIHLVVGPPGTGKTVIAVYRAEMHKKGGMSTQFLMYNNTLDQYLAQAVELRGLGDVTSTFHKWFWSWYTNMYHKDPPTIQPYVFDWNQIYLEIGKKPFNRGEKFSHLVIDEGQDFPIEMYRVIPMFVDNLIVFADENQRIRDHNTTVKQIQQVLGLDKIHPLTRNYRNTRQIAEFASNFYAGLDSGIPDLPERQGAKPRVHLGLDWKSQMEVMVRYARNNPEQHIGVFAATKKQIKAAYNWLLRDLKGSVPVQVYISDDKEKNYLNFNRAGIKLMCYPSAKGLEFDTVFLPLLHTRRTDSIIDNEKMRFFVLSSRARDDLIMMTEATQVPWLMRHVPDSSYRTYSL